MNVNEQAVVVKSDRAGAQVRSTVVTGTKVVAGYARLGGVATYAFMRALVKGSQTSTR